MIEILPAVLPKNYSELESSLEKVVGAVYKVQVDIVDGIFAPNKTWPYGDMARFKKICVGDEGLPFWDSFDFQFDCMLARPDEQVEDVIAAGASGVVLHAQSEGALKAAQMLADINTDAGEDFRVSVGVALRPGATLQELEPFLGLYDFVQVMGIQKVGFQGEVLDERVFSLLRELRAAYPQLLVQVDGGVRENNIRSLAEAGAQRFVVGSAIFGAPNPVAAIAGLRGQVRN